MPFNLEPPPRVKIEPYDGPTLEDILDRQREKSRPPWYERAPWSWFIGFAFGIAGAGVAFWLGWN